MVTSADPRFPIPVHVTLVLYGNPRHPNKLPHYFPKRQVHPGLLEEQDAQWRDNKQCNKNICQLFPTSK